MPFRLGSALAAALCVCALLTPAAGSAQRATAAQKALFTANWKTPPTRWQAGGGKWYVQSAMLTNVGADPSTYVAPYRLARSKYAIEATIRLVAWRHSGTSENNLFGVLFRGGSQGAANPATGLVAGVARGFLGCDGLFSWAGVATADTDTEVLKETTKFRPGYGWHRYRVEVRGNALRVLVDGRQVNVVTSKRLANQTAVGLYALAAHIQVQDFKVLGL